MAVSTYLLARPNRLVPRSSLTVWVVCCNTGCRHGVSAHVAAGVRDGIFGFGFLLALFSLLLIRDAARQASQSALYGAGGGLQPEMLALSSPLQNPCEA